MAILNESQKILQQIIENSPDPIVETDLSGNVIYISRKGYELLGYSSQDDVIGKNISTWLHPDFKSKAMENFRRVAMKNPSHDNIYKMLKKNGGYVWSEINANLVFNEIGLPKAVVSFIHDITRRKDEEDRAIILLEILQHDANDSKELLDFALDKSIQLTKSKIGYIYYYSEEKKEFVLNTWSKDVMKECTITQPQSIYQLEKTGFWGEAVRQRKPMILNNFQAPHPLKKGYPQGHASLVKFMTVPVMDGEKIVAVVGVANKQEDYDEDDVRQLTLLMAAVWKVVQRQRSEEETFKKSQELEIKIKELEELNEVMVGRELKMAEMKEKLEKLGQ